MSVSADDEQTVEVIIDDSVHTLTTAQATALRSQLGDALVRHESFVRTAGTRRKDGSYEVSRRNADTAGNSTVFESFDQLRQQYEQLPSPFTATDVGQLGETGSRRHLLVQFFTEHPAFDCSITSRCPLTAEKDAETAGVPATQEGGSR